MLSARRRSCRACVVAKRRCDLGLPGCARCIARGLTCTYPWAESGTDSMPASNSGVTSNATMPFFADGNSILPLGVTTQDSSWTGAATPNDTINYLPSLSSMNPSSSVPAPLSPAMMSLLEDIIGHRGVTSPLDLGLPPTTLLNLATGSPPQSIPTVDDLPKGTVTAGNKFQPRTEYVARRLTTQACALVEKGQTAFIHHTQVGASAVLQDALAASALHAMRNSANAAIVRCEIARRAALLVNAVEAAISYYPSIDLLPPVQSLLVYQCIRLFSMNDIIQQAQAERDAVTLSQWVNKLRQEVRPCGFTSDWIEWVRQESVRRAVLFFAVVTGVYTFLKLGFDTGDVEVAPLEFTGQAALWEARSAAEWRQVWGSSPRFELTIATLTRDTEGAGCDDFEELGVMFRALSIGLEALEEWAGGDRTVLKRWGLRGDRPLPAY